MGTGPGSQPPLKVDPDLLSKYGNQLLTAAGDLPAAPPPFSVTGLDAISQAIAEKLPGLEGPIQEALPQLKDEASNTANNVVAAAGRYSDTDAQLAANYEKHQFDSRSGAAGAGGGANEPMSQMGQMMSMPMQMASQVAQMPAQALSALGQVPQGIMQGVQQIGQMAGGLGGGSMSAPEAKDAKLDHPVAQPDERNAEHKDKHHAPPVASGGTAAAERVPEPAPKQEAATTPVPQQGSPRHAAPDPTVNL